jgi:DNA primase
MEIIEIKQRLSITAVLAHYGLQADKNARLRCPFHEDKTPSMQVYEKTGTVYCFSGSCKTHGRSLDVIEFILQKENISKHEAIKKAESFLTVAPQPPEGELRTKVAPSSNPDIIPRSEFMGQFFRFCENSIKTSKPAKAYMQSRGLWQSTPSNWGIEMGFHSGSFHARDTGKPLIDSCLHYGLIRRNESQTGGYNVFAKNSLVFPLRDAGGEIVSLYFRTIIEDTTSKHYYLRDRKGLYPCYPRTEGKVLILTESVIDAASLCLHLPNTYEILALYGTNGFTDEHRQALIELPNLQEIILFLDGDEAGRKALESHYQTLKALLPSVKISAIHTPEGEDINSLLIAHEATILNHLIEQRTPFFSSTEKPLSIEKKEVHKENSTEVLPAITNRLKPTQQLHTENPNNLIYKGIAGEYHIKGGIKGNLDSLKISVQLIDKDHTQDYRSKIDLYEYKQVQSFCELAGQRLNLRSDELEKDLTLLARLLESYRAIPLPEHSATKSENPTEAQKPSSQMRLRCVEFLKKHNLLHEINALIGHSGVVGEENNRLLLFVIASSYAMPDPLHALVQGSSGSGKTHLLLQIAKFMPPEDTITLTRVTESSFYNYGEYDLRHKLLCMEDLDGMKEEAFLAFRELQSRGMLTSSTSVKDEQGNIKGMVKTVRGPIASMSATTKGEIYEDNMSRCFLIAVDESKEQTQRIIDYQNQVSAGEIDKESRKQLINFVQHCVRILSPYEVVNPFAKAVQLPPEAHKIRRLNELYQAFVRQVVLLNQFQRQKDDKGRLLATKEDLQTACEILFDSIVLKVDELDGSLRLFYEGLKAYVQDKGRDYEFTRREVREILKVSKTQQHSYLTRLEDLEYIRQSGGYINRGLHYKIIHWDSYTALRAKIKTHLESQLLEIK